VQSIYAGFADEESRAYVENDKDILWQNGDALSLYYSNCRNIKFEYNGEDGARMAKFDFIYGTGNLNDKTLKGIRTHALYPYNENASIDGAIAVDVPRRVQKRNVSIPFIMQESSLVNLEIVKAELEKELSSVHEVEVEVEELGTIFYLKYLDMDKYSNFDNQGKATLTLNFVELNPTRRKTLWRK
jgi:hypothetical protein